LVENAGPAANSDFCSVRGSDRKAHFVICQNRVADALPLCLAGSMMKRMSFSETIFLFVLALVIFGPKKLPEIARQIGKALNEFRRASNEFKAQIEHEIANLEIENKKAENKQQASLPSSAAPEGTTSRTIGSSSGSGDAAITPSSAEASSTATLAASAENPTVSHADEPAIEALPHSEASTSDLSSSNVSPSGSSPSGLHAEDISASEPVTSSAAQESHV
jgi:sec-independent protein translocase protein TatB